MVVSRFQENVYFYLFFRSQTNVLVDDVCIRYFSAYLVSDTVMNCAHFINRIRSPDRSSLIIDDNRKCDTQKIDESSNHYCPVISKCRVLKYNKNRNNI